MPQPDKWHKRVERERDELEIKRKLLETFLSSSAFHGLPLDHRSLLNNQFSAMSIYSNILKDRLALYEHGKA